MDRLDVERDTVHLSRDETHALGMDSLRKLGYTEAEARIIADQLVDNMLCGYRFAGLPRILAIAEVMREKPERVPTKMVRETESSALIDGGNNVAYLTCFEAAHLAASKARKTGFALVGVHNSYYSGRNAYFLDIIARQDLVGIHVASGGRLVAPLGGKRPALGTNPIAVGFPSQEGPIIFDMGTATVMQGEVKLAARTGEMLPEGAAIDENGRPTRDPLEALRGAILPFGGYKGYGLSFTIQALSQLAGVSLTAGTALDYGFLFIVFDPALTLPVADFKAHISGLIREIKAIPRIDGVDEILVPSDRSRRERERNRQRGLDVDRVVYDALRAL